MSLTRKRLLVAVGIICFLALLLYPATGRSYRLQSAQKWDTNKLLYEVYNSRNSSVHPAAVSDFIHASYDFGSPSPQVQNSGRVKILYTTVWLGGELPRYALLSLWSMSRKPTFDVSMLVDEKLQICTNPPEFIKNADNLRIVCLSLEAIHALIVDMFCTGWKCDTAEWYRIYDVLSSKMIEYPRTVSYWKPMMGALHRRQLGAYDKWAWFDLDTVHGDYERLFPWTDVANHNVFTFSYNHVWQKLYTHGQLSMFDTSEYFVFAWTRTRFGSSAKQFLSHLKEIGWHKMLSGFDEGAFAQVLLPDPKVTWMVRSGLHIADSQLWDNATIRIHADNPSLLVLPGQNISLSQENHMFSDLLLGGSGKSVYKTSHISAAETTKSCEDSEWIPPQERFCAVKYVTDQCPSFARRSKGSAIVQINTPCQDVIEKSHVVAREILFVHLHSHKQGVEEDLSMNILPNELHHLSIGQGYADYYNLDV